MQPKATIDTNYLVRIVTNDHPQIARRCLDVIKSYGNETILLDNAVFAELVFVLASPRLYAYSRQKIADSARTVLSIEQLACEREVLELAVDHYADSKLDFVDCLLWSQLNLKLHIKLLSLDEPLQKATTKSSK